MSSRAFERHCVIYLSVATETQCTSSDIISLNLRETPCIFVMIDTSTYLPSLLNLPLGP